MSANDWKKPMSVPSPCIGHCLLSESKICQGCFRSLDEIGAWSQLTDRAKLGIIARSDERAKLAKSTTDFSDSAQLGTGAIARKGT
jgi:uncharacterized protein